MNNDYAYLHRLGHRKWGWQIPLRNNITSIGIVGPCNDIRAANEDQDAHFVRCIEHNLIFGRAMAGAQRITPWRMVGDYSYRLQRLHGSGWLLVGDASGFIDPIFSSGVDIAMYSSVFAYESMLPLLLLRSWSCDDEKFAMSIYEQRLRRGVEIWTHAVNLFYGSARRLRQLANQPDAIAAICRFLQGNPYELQNELIIQQLFESCGQRQATSRSLSDSKANAGDEYEPHRLHLELAKCFSTN